MSAPKVYTEDEVDGMLDHAQGSSYYLGISSGWAEASEYVLKQASTFFEKGDDEAAGRLRRLSNELLKISKERRKTYDDREREYEARTAKAKKKAKS